MRYRVISLDVWGHGSDDCAEHRCGRCTDEDSDGNVSHDDNRCDCSFWVNDRHVAGEIDVADGADDAAIVYALVACGYLAAHVTSSDVAIDWSDDTFASIDDAASTMPLYQLEAMEES